ncbi:hypothetical protein NDI76_19335 [Halogeometricum sp. S1BR25-6]|uniref:Uncharacterized protein n=1 Tax=Halogeometricum salsisoli TaxID=2950536 RepID=A0ABU2GJD3_9EURY|nr:hypothetical protein [Halogeometricum sp. S1BR25-6]MDS0300905.1 hypothetical protein [Halogeometricum sp. S1BR25-6]
MTNQTIVDKLGEIRDAVAQDSIRDATTLFLELKEEYIDTRIGEAARHKQYLLVHNVGGVSGEERTALTKYVSGLTRVQMQRSELLTTGAQYVSGLEVNTDSLIEIVDKTQNVERSLLESRQTAESISVPEPLPASVSLLNLDTSDDQLPKGAPGDLTIVVANPGDKSAKGVQVELSSDGKLNFESNTLMIGSISGQKTVSTTITGTASGLATLEAEITSEDAGSDFGSTSLQVINKRSAAENAKTKIDNILDNIESAGPGKGGGRTVESKLSNADAKISDALRFIDQNRSKQANNVLNAASRMLGALLNQLSGQGKSGVNEFFVEQQVEATIETISIAKRAEM